MTETISLGQIHEVEITTLAFGGSGVSRSLGLVCFVPFSAPGDRLKVKITQVKKSFCEGEILEMLTASPMRTQAPCPAFGKCGGCNLQHITYKNQLEIKEEILVGIVKKQIKSQQVTVLKIIPSPNEFNYRNRIQIKTAHGKKGFYAKNTHEIVNINECMLAERDINNIFRSIGANSETETKKYSIKRMLSKKVEAKLIDDEEEGLGFSQVNEIQNQKLIELVSNEFKIGKFKIVFDLYGGAGNFAFPLENLPNIESLKSVELNSQASLAGKAEAQGKQSKVKFIHGDVADFLKIQSKSPSMGVLLDPPRQGCSPEVIRYLANLEADKIVYVSCNPTTLARDAELFLNITSGLNLKYEINPIQPLDMFPQTDHVEAVVSFTKKS